jgi:protein-disulfide isomerase
MIKSLPNFGLLCSTLCFAAFAATAGDTVATNSAVIVEIDGTKLTLADFEKKHPTALFQARNTFYDSQKKVVDAYVDEYILERQAKKEGVSVEDLIKKHVAANLPPDPSDEALRVYYEGVETAEPFETIKPQILDHLRQARLTKARTVYVKSLRAQSAVALRLGQPRAQVSLKDTPINGSADAPVMLVEFADYECPYCQVVHPSVAKLQAEFKGKLAFAYKDFPLNMHAHAQKAAEAAHCAGAQGKYWEMHNMLYETKELDPSKLKQDARTLKLDGAAFDKCLDNGEKASVVKMNMAEAQGFAMSGTPGFFVNGRYIEGAVQYETLRKMVEEELMATSGQLKETAKR